VNQQTGPPPYDLSPDYVYDSKGIVTPFGFQVVVRIPFGASNTNQRILRIGRSTF